MLTLASSRGTTAAEQSSAAMDRDNDTRTEDSGEVCGLTRDRRRRERPPLRLRPRRAGSARGREGGRCIVGGETEVDMAASKADVIFVVMILAFEGTRATLLLQACCGPNATSCQDYTRIEDMVGVACCSLHPMNTFTQLCCQRKSGSRFAELCCGDQALAYDQTCCEDVVHNVVGGNCCGPNVYDKEERGLICCNRTLNRAGPFDVCCGSDAFDSGRTQICCGQLVYDKSQYDSCCESTSGTYQPFRSESHFCCDTPQQRNAGRSCCYLRTEGGSIRPEPYDTDSECCTYPYRKITSMRNGSCID